MELRGKWWNGRWGRLARRDIWLYAHKGWLVRARHGDSDSRTREWHFTEETQARTWVEHLMATGGDGWQDMTDLYQRDRQES